MLQIPELDDISYEQLLQGAIHKIPMLTDEWTDFNHHDPGITTLEIYTWLTDMLHYYMNATGKIHIQKYMKLLGVEELPGKAAEAWVCLEAGSERGTHRIPKGFPVYAGPKCFLCEEEVEISGNRLRSLIYQGQEGAVDLTTFAGEDGSYARVFGAAGEAASEEALYFGFEKPLSGEVRLFITVRENPARRSLPENFSLSRLCFYAYDGSRWAAVQTVSDGTNGLLRSGVFTLKAEKPTAVFSGSNISPGYYLKAVLEENYYDVPPELGKCFLNPVRVVQKEELCSSLSIQIQQDKNRYEIPYYVSQGDRIEVAVWEEERQAYRICCSYESGREDGCRVDYEKREIVFSETGLPPAGTVIEVFLVEEEFVPQRQAGITDGCAGQELELALDHPYELELLLESGLGEGRYYTHWSQVRDLEKAGCEDCVFYFDQEKNSIRFGDGIHGRVPDRGCIVKAGRCSISSYEEGNVRAGEIRQIRDRSYGDIRAFNAAMAAGGRAEDSLQKMQKRFEEKVLEQSRIVSPGDYEKMVKEIPGLLIRGARIVAAQEYCRNHGLTYKPYDTYLVVCPAAMRHGDRLSVRYQEYICDYLERYRMLNTRVRVVPPAYGGINISGSICLAGSRQTAREEIRLFFRDYLREKEMSCEFGAVISYGDIFMQLESMAIVERVEELHLSLGGEMGRRTEKGDILLNSDCLPYLGDVDFEYKE
ncbi:MAG: hypothetical protein MR430_01350 [Lachnospiraceae bacterium]|nr:hypothetical protein [Lachnospiraceae bacterium]